MNEAKRLLLLTLLCLAGFIVSQDLCLWSAPRILHYPSLFVLFVGGCVSFGVLAAIPASLYFAVRAIANWRNRPAMFSYFGQMAVCVLFAVGFAASVLWMNTRRSAAFARAAVNGTTIVTALESYHAQNGVYPKSLNQLVPKHLPAVPWTGLVGYPQFSYDEGMNDILPVVDSYELRIDCTSGGINFDRFIYWPSKTYPTTIQGNRTERIGGWVYVHE